MDSGFGISGVKTARTSTTERDGKNLDFRQRGPECYEAPSNESVSAWTAGDATDEGERARSARKIIEWSGCKPVRRIERTVGTLVNNFTPPRSQRDLL